MTTKLNKLFLYTVCSFLEDNYILQVFTDGQYMYYWTRYGKPVLCTKGTTCVLIQHYLSLYSRFTYVDMGHFGGEGDSGIFLRSRLLDCFNRRLFGVPPPANVGSIGLIPYVLVGDEAFPLKTFMMRPYPQRGKFRCACAAQFLS